MNFWEAVSKGDDTETSTPQPSFWAEVGTDLPKGGGLLQRLTRERDLRIRQENIVKQAPVLNEEMQELTRGAGSTAVANIPLIGKPLAFTGEMAAAIPAYIARGGTETISGLATLGYVAGALDDSQFADAQKLYGRESAYTQMIEAAVPPINKVVGVDPTTGEAIKSGSPLGWVDPRNLVQKLAPMAVDVALAFMSGGATIAAAKLAGASIAYGSRTQRMAQGVATAVGAVTGTATESESVFLESMELAKAKGLSDEEARREAFTKYTVAFTGSLALNAGGMAKITHMLPDNAKNAIAHRLVAGGIEGVTEFVEEIWQAAVVHELDLTKMKEAMSAEAFVIGALGGAIFAGNGTAKTTPEGRRLAVVTNRFKKAAIGDTIGLIDDGIQYTATKIGNRKYDIKPVEIPPNLGDQLADGEFKSLIDKAAFVTFTDGTSMKVEPGSVIVTDDVIHMNTTPYAQLNAENQAVSFKVHQVLAIETVDGQEHIAQGWEALNEQRRELGKKTGKTAQQSAGQRHVKRMQALVRKVEDFLTAASVEGVESADIAAMEAAGVDIEGAFELNLDQAVRTSLGTATAFEPQAGGTIAELIPTRQSLSRQRQQEKKAEAETKKAEFAQAHRDKKTKHKEKQASKVAAQQEAEAVAQVQAEEQAAATAQQLRNPYEGVSAKAQSLLSAIDAGAQVPAKMTGELSKLAKLHGIKGAKTPLDVINGLRAVTLPEATTLFMSAPATSTPSFKALEASFEAWAEANGDIGFTVKDSAGNTLMDTKLFAELKADMKDGKFRVVAADMIAASALPAGQFHESIDAIKKGETTAEEAVLKRYQELGYVKEGWELKGDGIIIADLQSNDGVSTSLIAREIQDDINHLKNVAATEKLIDSVMGAANAATLSSADFEARFLKASEHRVKVQEQVRAAAIMYNWEVDGKGAEEAADLLNRINFAVAEALGAAQGKNPEEVFKDAISDVLTAQQFTDFVIKNQASFKKSDVSEAQASILKQTEELVLGGQSFAQKVEEHLDPKVRLGVREFMKSLAEMENGAMLELGKTGMPKGTKGFEIGMARALFMLVGSKTAMGDRVGAALTLNKNSSISGDNFAHGMLSAIAFEEIQVANTSTYNPNQRAAFNAQGIPYHRVKAARKGHPAFHVFPEHSNDMTVSTTERHSRSQQAHAHREPIQTKALGWLRYSYSVARGLFVIDEVQSDTFAALARHKKLKALSLELAKGYDEALYGDFKKLLLAGGVYTDFFNSMALINERVHAARLDAVASEDYAAEYNAVMAIPPVPEVFTTFADVLQTRIDEATAIAPLSNLYATLAMHKAVQFAGSLGLNVAIVSPEVIIRRTLVPSAEGTPERAKQIEAIRKSYGEVLPARLRDVLSFYSPSMKKVETYNEMVEHVDGDIAVFNDFNDEAVFNDDEVVFNDELTVFDSQDFVPKAAALYNHQLAKDHAILFSKEQERSLGMFVTGVANHGNVVAFFKGSNLHTGLHEMGHVWRYALKGADLEKARKWSHKMSGSKIPKEGWTTPAEEFFANSFMAYALNAKVTNPELSGLFEKLRSWLLGLHGQMQNAPLNYSPEMEEFFGNLTRSSIEALPKEQRGMVVEMKVRESGGMYKHAKNETLVNKARIDEMLRAVMLDMGIDVKEKLKEHVSMESLVEEAARIMKNDPQYLIDLDERLRLEPSFIQLAPVDMAIIAIYEQNELTEMLDKIKKAKTRKARVALYKEMDKAQQEIFAAGAAARSAAGRSLNAAKLSYRRIAQAQMFAQLDALMTDVEKHHFRNAQARAKRTGSEALNEGFMREMRLFNETGHAPEVFARVMWELWYASMLSSPSTHAVNIMSTLLWSSIYTPVHIAAAGTVDAAVHGVAKSSKFGKNMMSWYYQGGEVDRKHFVSELLPHFIGLRRLPSGLRAAKDIMWKGYSDEVALQAMEYDTKAVNLVSAERLKLPSELAAERRNVYGNTMRGVFFLAGSPLRALKAADAVFGVMAYDSILGREYYKEAVKGSKNSAEAAKLARRMAQNPDGVLGKERAEEVRKIAEDGVRYSVFMDAPGAWARHLVGLRNVGGIAGGITRVQLPFVNTLVNLFKRGLELTPVVGLVAEHQHRTQLMGDGKTPSTYAHTNADVIAKQIEGTLLALMLVTYLMEGDDDGEPLFTGPVPKETRARELFFAAGRQPWSIRYGDSWYSYRNIEPFNTPLMLIGALLGETQSGEKLSDRTMETHVSGILDATFILLNQGLFRNFEALTSGDEDKLQQKITQIGKTMVPYNGLFRFLAKELNKAYHNGDYVPYEVEGFFAEMTKDAKDTLNLLSDLPPTGTMKRDTWGEPKVYSNESVFLFWLPFRKFDVKADDVDKELVRLGSYYPSFPERVRTHNGQPLPLDDETYTTFILASGAESKERLAKLFAAPYYQRLSGEKKLFAIRDIINAARDKHSKKAVLEQLRANRGQSKPRGLVQ